jgi:hypothetical protein
MATHTDMQATLHLSQDPDADALLSSEPLALLIGMVLDQQIPHVWSGVQGTAAAPAAVA